ncbi:MAG: HK97 family phage prohead protease [Pseudomonadota bacterium]
MVQEETIEFEGYACIFNTCDQVCDLVHPGAFSAALSARGAGGVRMLFNHDVSEPIGIWNELREDIRGLYCRGTLLAGVQRAQEVATLLSAGGLDGLSIGFTAKRAQADPTTGIRHLREVDLWEISLVTFPMQDMARITRINALPVDSKGSVPQRTVHSQQGTQTKADLAYKMTAAASYIRNQGHSV